MIYKESFLKLASKDKLIQLIIHLQDERMKDKKHIRELGEAALMLRQRIDQLRELNQN